jgi:hypothetical protein
MAEQEIKRVNFFNGQFLKELEFQEEQKYHMHMRRRLNYILFNQSGVVLVNGNELTLNTDISTPAIKNFTVRAGLAISKDTDVMEGKEIILRQDITKSLDAEGIESGQTAYITVHFAEEGAKDPPSEGDEDQDTRIKENAVIKAHSTNPTGGTADNGEEYIVLGTINYDTMASADTGRQLAQINHYLVGAAPAALVSIEIIPGTVSIEEGGTWQLTARGHFSDGSQRDLGAGDGLTWESNNNSIVTVVDGLVTGVILGSATITASAMGQSATATVNVVTAAPTLVGIAITPISPTVTVGSTIPLTATGTFSVGPPQTLSSGEVTWSSDDNSVANVDSNGTVTGVSAGTTNITATSTEDTAIDDTVPVTVNPAATPPVIDFLSPDRQISNATINVHGTDIRDSALAPPSPATGTTIRFFKGPDSKDGSNLIIKPNVAANQVVEVTVPDRSGTPWGNKEEVTLELTFNGLPAQFPFRYDDS